MKAKSSAQVRVGNGYTFVKLRGTIDEDNQLSALFRYSMAVRSRRPEVAPQFEAAAVLEYLFGRELYDRVWGEFIPAELRDFAAQFLLGVDEEQAWPSA